MDRDDIIGILCIVIYDNIACPLRHIDINPQDLLLGKVISTYIFVSMPSVLIKIYVQFHFHQEFVGRKL